MIYFEDYEWHDSLEDGELKDKALTNKAILDGSVNVEEKLSQDAWRHYSLIDEWKDYENTTYIKTDVDSNYNFYLNECRIFNNHARTNNDDEIQENIECFDEHESMKDDDDDIRDLSDFLILNKDPYYANEEEERSKERQCKLLGIPYKKPSTCKSEKFKVVKYSFGPTEEYVAIKEYEYDIWV
ncbi:hypothetical protein Tco_0700816 [Tanacetum coccineum]